jgi:hypothetical protein
MIMGNRTGLRQKVNDVAGLHGASNFHANYMAQYLLVQARSMPRVGVERN